MKIISTIGIAILYFLVAIGIISTLDFAVYLLSRPAPSGFAVVSGVFLLIGTLIFVASIVMQIITEYQSRNKRDD